MAEPINWKSKIILAKAETTYGVYEALDGATDAMLMSNVSISPMDGEEISRDIELPYLGAEEQIVVALRSVLQGSVELVGPGANGVAPAWSPLLRACGVAEVITPETGPGANDGSVVYNPVSENHESVSIDFYIGETLHRLLGVRGTATISMNANEIPRMNFTLTGIWVQPTNAARPAVDLSRFQAPVAASTLNTPEFQINGVNFVMRNFSLDLANDVQQRLLVGRDSVLIVDRNDAISTTVEAQPLTAFNPFELARSKQRMPIAITHGTQAGRRARLLAPTASVNRPQGYESDQNILEWPLTFSALPTSAGDDQWSLTIT